MTTRSDRWSGRFGFVLAMLASAVGLGSIWKFPYELGANGGGGFLLFYVLGLALVVGPLMVAELVIGRRGQLDASLSMAHLASSHGASTRWGMVGSLGMIVSCLILSYYSVIGGWAIAYAVDVAANGLPVQADASQARFDGLLEAPQRTLFFHTLFMVIISAIVARGVAAGIERAVKVLMPALIVLMVILCAYSLMVGNREAALRFLFMPDLSRLSTHAALEALGLGFFSIGVGYATLMTYAAYADRKINLGQVALITLVGDTSLSLVAGLAVFPLVFAHGLDPGSGPGLAFVTLPLAFAGIPFGAIAAVAFFLCLSLAAIASAISMLEMPVAFLMRRLGWPRTTATLLSAGMVWFVGIATVASFSNLRDWHPLTYGAILANATVFELIDGLSSNVLLPAAGLGISLFAGWVLPATVLENELGWRSVTARALSIQLRYVVPIVIVMAGVEPLLRPR
jgi:neurotransmitter:Na+ symporter, NSS family